MMEIPCPYDNEPLKQVIENLIMCPYCASKFTPKISRTKKLYLKEHDTNVIRIIGGIHDEPNNE